jgi:hypothetical protein
MKIREKREHMNLKGWLRSVQILSRSPLLLAETEYSGI